MRRIVLPFLVGAAVGVVLFFLALALDPHVPLIVPLWPGFLIQQFVRAVGVDVTNRILVWATPFGWGLVGVAFASAVRIRRPAR